MQKFKMQQLHGYSKLLTFSKNDLQQIDVFINFCAGNLISLCGINSMVMLVCLNSLNYIGFDM